MTTTRTRFAPSPTGKLHIGSLRTALFAYLVAKKHGGNFVLRIEDTDQSREEEGAAEHIVTTLNQFGLVPDEGPYVQSTRLDIYKKHADILLEEGSAYVCFCTPARLRELRERQQAARQITRYDGLCKTFTAEDVVQRREAGEPFVVRLRVPDEGETEVVDAVYGRIVVPNADIDDQVLMKSDGFPTYHLAVVVDDHAMNITHVIRGEEWLPSTPKHVLLYRAFGWELPLFAHLPLIVNTDKTKLSKRQGDANTDAYLKEGYLPEAMINFLALLGWNPGTEQEIFSLNELIAAFSLDRVHKANAIMNTEKLDWMNAQYIRALSIDRFRERATSYLKEAGYRADTSVVNAALATVQDRVKRLREIPALTHFYFTEPRYEPTLLVWKKSDANTARIRMTALNEFFSTEDIEWSADALERRVKDFIDADGGKVGETLWPMRVALTGEQHSPGPFAVAAVLGKEKTQSRIAHAIKLLS